MVTWLKTVHTSLSCKERKRQAWVISYALRSKLETATKKKRKNQKPKTKKPSRYKKSKQKCGHPCNDANNYHKRLDSERINFYIWNSLLHSQNGAVEDLNKTIDTMKTTTNKQKQTNKQTNKQKKKQINKQTQLQQQKETGKQNIEM